MNNTKVTREEQKTEAVKRMQALRLKDNVIKDFISKDIVYYSEKQNPIFDGILYWMHNEPTYMDILRSFEKEHNAVVYHAQLSHTAFGDLLALLYVSENKNEWSDDYDELLDGYTYAYVANLDDPMCSEIGEIGVVPRCGGVTRTF